MIEQKNYLAFIGGATAMTMFSEAVVIPRAVAIRMGDPRVNRKAIPASTLVLVISQSSTLPGSSLPVL